MLPGREKGACDFPFFELNNNRSNFYQLCSRADYKNEMSLAFCFFHDFICPIFLVFYKRFRKKHPRWKDSLQGKAGRYKAPFQSEKYGLVSAWSQTQQKLLTYDGQQ